MHTCHLSSVKGRLPFVWFFFMRYITLLPTSSDERRDNTVPLDSLRTGCDCGQLFKSLWRRYRDNGFGLNLAVLSIYFISRHDQSWICMILINQMCLTEVFSLPLKPSGNLLLQPEGGNFKRPFMCVCVCMCVCVSKSIIQTYELIISKFGTKNKFVKH